MSCTIKNLQIFGVLHPEQEEDHQRDLILARPIRPENPNENTCELDDISVIPETCEIGLRVRKHLQDLIKHEVSIEKDC